MRKHIYAYTSYRAINIKLRNRLDDEVIITIYLHEKYANCVNTRGQLNILYTNNLLKKIVELDLRAPIFSAGWFRRRRRTRPASTLAPRHRGGLGRRLPGPVARPRPTLLKPPGTNREYHHSPGKINATRMARERRSFAARLIIDVLYLPIRHDEYHNTNNKSAINTVSINLLINCKFLNANHSDNAAAICDEKQNGDKKNKIVKRDVRFRHRSARTLLPAKFKFCLVFNIGPVHEL